MKILGIDPSLRNWGLAVMELDKELTILKTHTIRTNKIPKHKSVAVTDVNTAKFILDELKDYLEGIDAICIELPLGSQTSTAMKSYGLCIGLVGYIATLGIPVIYKNPFDIKKVIGKRDTTKEEIIDWVNTNHPNKLSKYKTVAEHQADAVLAVYASLNELKELL